MKDRSAFKTKDKKHRTDQTLIYVTLLCQGNRHGTDPILRSAVSFLLNANSGNYLFYAYPAVYTGFPAETAKKESGIQMAFKLSNIFPEDHLSVNFPSALLFFKSFIHSLIYSSHKDFISGKGLGLQSLLKQGMCFPNSQHVAGRGREERQL